MLAPVSGRARATIVAWMLYDFANSSVAAIVVATVYPVYFANVVVGNATGRGDALWGLATSATMIIAALTSPLLGGVADHAGARKPFFVGFTLLSVAATALLATVGPGMVARGFVLTVASLVGYEAAVVYYNSYLPRIVTPDRVGRVSAGGFAVGYAGSVAAFAAAWPFVQMRAYGGCFVAAAALFLVFSVPSFVVLPADERRAVPLRVALARGVAETLTTLGEITRRPERRELKRFLVAYLFYEDGVNTVIFFAGIFASKTLGFTFPEIIGLFLLVQVTALLGSAAWARAADVRGSKHVVTVTLVQWTAVTALAFLVTAKWQFWLVAILAGTGLGAIQAASRSLMATLVPNGREAEFFGFYSLVGKTGAILGPLVFGTVSWLLHGNQRAAILSIAAFFVVGFVLLRPVRAGGPTVRAGP